MEGPTTGLWHMTVRCELALRADGTHLGQLWWSYVGIRVEPPPWEGDTGLRHMLVGELSFSDALLARDVEGRTGRPIANASDGLLEWQSTPSGWLLRARIRDDVHGTFETMGAVRELGAVPAQTTRMWLLDSLGFDAAAGNRFVPIPVDFQDVPLGGGTAWGVRDGAVTFNHREPGGELAHAEYMGAFYAATDVVRSMTLPEAPHGVVLNRSWAH